MWINNSEKLYSENDVFYISTDIILDNLYYKPIGNEWLDIIRKLDGKHHISLWPLSIKKRTKHPYYDVFNGIKKNGWNIKYPAKIGIGKNKEIFIRGGNHRCNMLKKLNIKKIPFKFAYLTINYNKSHNLDLLNIYREDSLFYPDKLLPKWEKS